MSLARFASTAVILTAFGCSSDLAGPAMVEPLTVAGDWFYFSSDLTGQFFDEAVSCEYGFEMTLQVNGTDFSGVYNRALMTCLLFGQNELVDAGGGNIVSGSRSGSSVQFDVDTDNIRNTGTLSRDGAGELMTGAVSIELIIQRDAAIDTVIISGNWFARR